MCIYRAPLKTPRWGKPDTLFVWPISQEPFRISRQLRYRWKAWLIDYTLYTFTLLIRLSGSEIFQLYQGSIFQWFENGGANRTPHFSCYNELFYTKFELENIFVSIFLWFIYWLKSIWNKSECPVYLIRKLFGLPHPWIFHANLIPRTIYMCYHALSPITLTPKNGLSCE